MYDYQTYLDTICAQIADPKKSEEIRNELLCHIEERVNDYLERGYPKETAYQKAIESMGNPELPARQFGALHSFHPMDAFRGSFAMLCWGLFLSTIYLIPSIQQVTSFLGIALILIAVWRMKSCNQRLKNSLFSVFNYLFSFCRAKRPITPSVSG